MQRPLLRLRKSRSWRCRERQLLCREHPAGGRGRGLRRRSPVAATASPPTDGVIDPVQPARATRAVAQSSHRGAILRMIIIPLEVSSVEKRLFAVRGHGPKPHGGPSGAARLCPNDRGKGRSAVGEMSGRDGLLRVADIHWCLAPERCDPFRRSASGAPASLEKPDPTGDLGRHAGILRVGELPIRRG